MRGKPLKMHHIREVLRLAATGTSNRMVSGCLGIARSTVADVLERAEAAGLTWPLAPEIGDAELAQALYQRPARSPHLGARRHAEPDWAAIHLELKRPHVTLALLYEEYRAQHPVGYGYSRFCELYRGFEEKLAPTMRQTHVAGDKLYVDFAGGTVPVMVDKLKGTIRQAQIFVACLGASSYTYVEATWGQTTADWVGAQASALGFFGGSPRLIVPDNPRAAIAKRASTSLASSAPMATLPLTMASACLPPARESHATKPRLRAASSSPSDGSWPSCATSGSPRWPNSTPRSGRWLMH